MPTDKEIDDYLRNEYRSKLAEATKWLIIYAFPDIENLEVKQGEGDNLLITFNEGKYTKKEVKFKIKELKEEFGKPIQKI